jgi:hypothetical protein
MNRHRWAWAAAGIVLAAASAASGATPGEVRFKKITLDKTFRAEGVAVGDVNHDGKLDVITGDVWYAAPDWKMHEIRKVGEYKPAEGYSQCFANFAMDVNGDGWVDSIVVGFPGAACLWYENPKNQPGYWKEHQVWKSACNETPLFADLLGSGKPVPLFGIQPEKQVAWFSVPKDLEGPWDCHPVSKSGEGGSDPFSHGLGVGDVNRDGRNDVLVTNGWWEAPEDRTKGEWTFHKASLGPACANLLVYDVDDDGDNDVITSSAHDYGIWWFEQVKTDQGVEWKQHEIFKEFSQPHAIILVDMNGDGVMDLMTGKRWYAHNGGDPGGKEAAVLYWFELKRPEKGKVEFIPHKIDDDSGVGTQFEVADMNGDKKPDIITSNKKGVYVFLQEK